MRSRVCRRSPPPQVILVDERAGRFADLLPLSGEERRERNYASYPMRGLCHGSYFAVDTLEVPFGLRKSPGINTDYLGSWTRER